MKKKMFLSKYFVLPLTVFFCLFMTLDSFPFEAGNQEKTFEQLLTEGTRLYQEGEYEEAIDVCLKALSLARTPNQYSDVYFHLSLFYYSIADMGKTEDYLLMMFRVDPEKLIDEFQYPLGYINLFKGAKQKNLNRLLEETEKRRGEEKEQEDITPTIKTTPQPIPRPRRKKNSLLLVLGGVVLAGGVVAVLAFGKSKNDGNGPPGPSPSTTGDISISSDPSGAQVYLDGASQGQTTPCTLSNISEGAHTLKLDLAYYGMWEGSVQVSANQTTSVDEDLSPYKYEYVTKWGTEGSGSYQFNNPRGIAVDQSGYVYVADTFNHRIVKYDSNGSYILEWGGMGSGNDQLQYPTRLATDSSGYIYAADSENHRIVRYDASGNYISKIGGSFGSGEYQFKYATGVTVDKEENVYVADYENNRIVKYNSSGSYLTQWGSLGSGNNQFHYPTDIASDGSNNIYVVDKNNHRISKFDSGGNFLTNWGSYGSGENQFMTPLGIGIDSHNYVFVGDSDNNRIVKNNSQGEFVLSWGSFGSGNDQFHFPAQVAFDSSDNMYVIDSGNHRVVKYKLSTSTLSFTGISYSPSRNAGISRTGIPPRNVFPGRLPGLNRLNRYPFEKRGEIRTETSGRQKEIKESNKKSTKK